MYLVDLVAVSLVSWIVIMAGFVCWIMSCRLGSAMLSKDAFHDNSCVICVVLVCIWHWWLRYLCCC